jgi:hypothetical protein
MSEHPIKSNGLVAELVGPELMAAVGSHAVEHEEGVNCRSALADQKAEKRALCHRAGGKRSGFAEPRPDALVMYVITHNKGD